MTLACPTHTNRLHHTQAKYSFPIAEEEWLFTGFGALSSLDEEGQASLCSAVVDGVAEGPPNAR